VNSESICIERPDSQYRLLFESNPIPMWVFHRETLRFLAVNRAAIRQYGYSEAEFLGMTIADIRPAGTIAELMQDVALRHRGLQQPGLWKHHRKDGAIFDVEWLVTIVREPRPCWWPLTVTEREQAQEAARAGGRAIPRDLRHAVIGIFRPLNINRAFAQIMARFRGGAADGDHECGGAAVCGSAADDGSDCDGARWDGNRALPEGPAGIFGRPGLTITMGRSMAMKVVAEGVETEAQLAFLREQGCDEIQGYYVSPPIGSGEMAALLGTVSFAQTEVLLR
jgi:PAS domain S-box-containing protein